MALSAPIRFSMVFVFDLLAVALAWLGAFALRFNLDWPHGHDDVLWVGMAGLLLLQAVLVWRLGMHRSMWSFSGLPEMRQLVRLVGASALVVLLATVLLRDIATIPRSVVLLYPLLLMALMGGGRLGWRMWREHRRSTLQALRAKQAQSAGAVPQAVALPPTGKPVVVVGAGQAAAMLLREIQHSPEWQVVGLVDDDPKKWGLDLLGYRVLGGLGALPQVLADTGAQHVLVAIASSQTAALRRLTSLVGGAGVSLLTVPDLTALMSGKVAVNAIRPVLIEDLLGRDSVSIDTDHIRAMILGRTVLVTGAGGSIGSELCRQVAQYNPGRLVLFDSSEFALYGICQWFADHAPQVPVVALVGDVKDTVRVRQVFATYGPSLVLHAAAYKHVPLMECDNAWQAVRNNVWGTNNVARCAQEFGADRFVLVSTDKAVNPTNVMGATKRLAEMLCESFNRAGSDTRFTMVRFGNVLGSTGSVIPRFRAQILAGGPLTVTHPDITRYFMLIPEAAQLVLQAATMGRGGEIFVLDMGEPVRIVDLARSMLRLSGLTEDQIKIEFTGLRPGEKLYEELLADTEHTLPTPHAKLRIAQSRSVADPVVAQIQGWVVGDEPLSDDQVRQALQRWVPEYAPAVAAEVA